MEENNLINTNNILLCKNIDIFQKNIEIQNFYGVILFEIFDINEFKNKRIYFCGDVKENLNLLQKITNLKIIRELSTNYADYINDAYPFISINQVPLNIYNVGIFYRSLFPNANYFERIENEHKFQELTESNKPSNAFRTGLYLSQVIKNEEENETYFNLMRCSTNFNGATENFKETDHEIIHIVNNEIKYNFTQPVELNHVLVQKYNNLTINGKEKKAKISRHSDKTKDMPQNAVMAFCTFYDKNPTYDMFLTKIKFKLKNKIMYPDLQDEFVLQLYQNSVFIIPLSTNRLYTHEILSSDYPITRLPTRIGYVIRCSNTQAIHKNNKTYIYDTENNLIELHEPTKTEIKTLKDTYFFENTTDLHINYGETYFSLNEGDYKNPIL